MTADAITALQGALAGEHATIWAYGEIGAHVSDGLLAAVAAADNAHRAQRDALEERIRALGQVPVASKPGYTPPAIADDPSALAVAAALEDAMSAQWRYCCGMVAEADRAFCVDALATSTTAALAWRRMADGSATPPALPGMA